MARKKIHSTNFAYFTKRVLVSSARAGGIKASKEAMDLMGHIVVSHKGWIIRKYADGRTEKIKRISSTEKLSRVLD